MNNNTERMQFFALATLLKALCAYEAFKQLEDLHVCNPDKHKRVGLLRGYGLVIKAILHCQIELTITYPGILGMQNSDKDLLRWWYYSETKYANRFSKVMQVDAPKAARVGNYLNNLLLRVNRSGDNLERFREAAANVLLFAQTALSMIENCRLVVGLEADTPQNIDQAMRLCAAEYLHDFIYHNFMYEQGDHTLDDADVYSRANSRMWVDGNILEDFGVSSVETSRDIVGRQERARGKPHKHLLLGINAAVAISLHQTGLQKQMLYRECEGLISDNEIYGDLLKQFQAGAYPSQRCQLTLQTQIPEQQLETIMSFDSSPMDSREQLSDLLGDRAFLVSTHSSSADFHFQVLIRGLLDSVPASQTVEVLRIDHSEERDELPPPVSLAVLVDGEWQVFYCIDRIGRMNSQVCHLLKGLGSRLNQTTIDGVDTNDLLRLCDRSFQYVTSQLKEQKDVNSQLRGTIPEILAGLLLANKGYHPVKVSLNLKLNRKEMEIDAIGLREAEEGGECLLVEVKKSTTLQSELMSELEKFARKVASARGNYRALERATGYAGSLQKVSGLFISMAHVGDLPGIGTKEAKSDPYEFAGDSFLFDTNQAKAEFKAFLEGLPHVEFWDHDHFISELNSVGLPELPIKLLKCENIIWESPSISIDDDLDILGILARAVENDDWQWPGSIGAVQDILDETLRKE